MAYALGESETNANQQTAIDKMCQPSVAKSAYPSATVCLNVLLVNVFLLNSKSVWRHFP